MEEKEKHVRIRVDTVIRDATGEEETLSLETLGVSGIREETPYISYRETELVGLEGTTTTVHIEENRVILERSGTFLQRQEYKVGVETHSDYNTPMGILGMKVITRELDISWNNGIGVLRMVYDISVDGLFEHVNEIIIDVREESDFHGNQGTTAINH